MLISLARPNMLDVANAVLKSSLIAASNSSSYSLAFSNKCCASSHGPGSHFSRYNRFSIAVLKRSKDLFASSKRSSEKSNGLR